MSDAKPIPGRTLCYFINRFFLTLNVVKFAETLAKEQNSQAIEAKGDQWAMPIPPATGVISTLPLAVGGIAKNALHQFSPTATTHPIRVAQARPSRRAYPADEPRGPSNGMF